MKDNSSFMIGLLLTIGIAAIAFFVGALLVNYDIIPNPFAEEVVLEPNTNIDFEMEGYTLEEMAAHVVKHHITDDMSDYDKYKILHDFIVEWATYDHKGLFEKDPERHDPRLVFSWKRGVCDAYAYAYEALCDAAGLYCRVITGLSDKTDKSSGHAWNIIMLDNQSYHVDVTWDDPCYEDGTEVGVVYDYWLLSDNTLRKEGREFDNENCTDSSYEGCEYPNSR